MKNVTLILFALLWAAHAQPITGQKGVQQSLITWSAASGNWSSKTRHAFLGNNVYIDTSSTGQAGQFKRVDNTADSCSNPFMMGTDTNGTFRPIWEYRLWETVRSVDGDSSTHTYRVNTRERVWDNSAKSVRWTPWTRTGSNTGFSDITVQDSVNVPNAGTTSKISQYGLFMVAGSMARLCPDDIAGTANGTTDTVFADSLIVYTR